MIFIIILNLITISFNKLKINKEYILIDFDSIILLKILLINLLYPKYIIKKMTKPRFELGTHTVLRCCHNQLDHSAGYFFIDLFIFITNSDNNYIILLIY